MVNTKFPPGRGGYPVSGPLNPLTAQLMAQPLRNAVAPRDPRYPLQAGFKIVFNLGAGYNIDVRTPGSGAMRYGIETITFPEFLSVWSAVYNAYIQLITTRQRMAGSFDTEIMLKFKASVQGNVPVLRRGAAGNIPHQLVNMPQGGRANIHTRIIRSRLHNRVHRNRNINQPRWFMEEIVYEALMLLGDNPLTMLYGPGSDQRLAPIDMMNDDFDQSFFNIGLELVSLKVIMRQPLVGKMPSRILFNSGILTLFLNRPQDHKNMTAFLIKTGLSVQHMFSNSQCLFRAMAIAELDWEGVFHGASEFHAFREANKSQCNKVIERRRQSIRRSVARRMVQRCNVDRLWRAYIYSQVPEIEHLAIDQALIEVEHELFKHMSLPTALDVMLLRREQLRERHPIPKITYVIIEPPTLKLDKEVRPVAVLPVRDNVDKSVSSGVVVLGNHATPLLKGGKKYWLDRMIYEDRTVEPVDFKKPQLAHDMIAFDLETFQEGGLEGVVIPYMAQVAWGERYEDSIAYTGPNCIQDMLESFYPMLENSTSKTIVAYAHNGAKFDGIFVLDWLLHFARKQAKENQYHGYFVPLLEGSIIDDSGKVMSLNLEYRISKNQVLGNVLFNDSLSYARGTLAGLAKGYNLPMQKDTMVYEDFVSWDFIYQHRDEAEVYGRKDAVVLWQLMTRIIKGYDELVPGLSITHYPTIAGYARGVFFNFYLDVPFWNASLLYQDGIRKWYRGGIAENSVQGVVRLIEPKDYLLEDGIVDMQSLERNMPESRIEQRDITSLYPHIMELLEFGVGEPDVLNGFEYLPDLRPVISSYVGEEGLREFVEHDGDHTFLLVTFYHKDFNGAPPLLWVDTPENGIIRPWVSCVNPQEMLLTPVEIRYLIKVGWLNMVVTWTGKGFKFRESKRVFKSFVNKFFEVKSTEAELIKTDPDHASMHLAKKEGAKSILNMSYGGLMMKLIRKILTIYGDKNHALEEQARFLTEFKVHGRVDNDVIASFKTLLGSSFTNVFWGMEISAGGRVVYYNMKYQNWLKHSPFLQGDTDSSMVLYPNTNYEEEVVQADPFWKLGKGLGGLLPDYGGYVITASAHVAPKVYAIEGVNRDTHKIEHIIKFKGLRRKDLFTDRNEYREPDGRKIISYFGHRSQNWFDAHPEEEAKQIGWEDFCALASDNAQAIEVHRYQMSAGLGALGTTGERARKPTRQRMRKRFGRRVLKGKLEEGIIGSSKVMIVVPHVLDELLAD